MNNTKIERHRCVSGPPLVPAMVVVPLGWYTITGIADGLVLFGGKPGSSSYSKL